MTESAHLTHVDAAGAARMVDVSAKSVSVRRAVAAGRLRTTAEVVDLLRRDGLPKGDALAVARVAGIMGAKRTADLVPLCHPLPLESVEVDLEPDAALPGVRAVATARVEAKTGVEMEALTAVTCALLTVYDMCKARDRGMELGGIRLLRKEGGRSGTWTVETDEG